MPNYCDFTIKAVGEKENLLKLISYIEADYCYDNEKSICECSADKHFYRIFEFDLSAKEEEIKDEFVGYGCCAWSVYSCMFSGEHTYYDSAKNISYAKHTHLLEASKELDLDIEIYSEEEDCFEEHYLIKKGVLLEEECKNYTRVYADDDEECEGEYTKVGGFGDWEWSI